MLGGGGAVGHGYHGGVLAALEEVVAFDARDADVIVGTSSGATVAGLVRAGLSGSDLASRACSGRMSERMHSVDAQRTGARIRPAEVRVRLTLTGPASPRGAWRATRRTDGARRLGPVFGALLPAGPMPTVTAGGALDRLFPHGWPSRAMWIAAVGIDDGMRVMFGRNGEPATDVATAVAASCALPGLFRPVVVDEQRYIDGAVWSATNADALADEALELVIVSAPLSAGVSPLHAWQRRHLRQEVRHLRSRGIPVVVIEPSRRETAAMGVNIMDKSRRQAVTRHVRASVRERLEQGDLARHRELLAG